MNFNVSILFMSLSAAAATILPIGVALYLRSKYQTSWKAVGIGALIFILFQPVLRFPLLRLLQGTSWYSYNSVVNPWLIAIVLGFSAAVFENIGRFVAFKFLLKGNRQWKNGIAYGIGHGGIEAILLAGIPLINSILLSISNPALLNQPSAIYLVGGLERIFAMTFHVAASLIVLYGVKFRKYRYLFYAILMHGLLDSSIGFIKNIALFEAWAGILAITLLVSIIIKIKRSSSGKILS
ncbi:YhfC family intramembrane metalloprotease [Clostridium swellfunianum]|uniref:YhfC family intramembrane metalloprotease n=1 Tax=Clostridium swellfunianum TaxID=1367462 RepID=UPI00202F83C1|nr:YhfC family glutamic-type intramembrane protease [Clostridium swellfunianum]MCM0648002.1 YhfC family intramembrane metalloprotease [Clostridium swellfunianum]